MKLLAALDKVFKTALEKRKEKWMEEQTDFVTAQDFSSKSRQGNVTGNQTFKIMRFFYTFCSLRIVFVCLSVSALI